MLSNSFIENSLGSKGLPSAGPHPNAVIFLACDAYGIMPPVSRLDSHQAMYHFISGYTAKMAGTETGIVDPVASIFTMLWWSIFNTASIGVCETIARKISKRASAPVYG